MGRCPTALLILFWSINATRFWLTLPAIAQLMSTLGRDVSDTFLQYQCIVVEQESSAQSLNPKLS